MSVPSFKAKVHALFDLRGRGSRRAPDRQFRFLKGVSNEKEKGVSPDEELGEIYYMATGRISNETRRTILEMAAAGENPEDIAQSLGRNLASVSRIIDGSDGKAAKKSGRRKGGKAAPPPPPAPRVRKSAAGTLTHHFWLRPGLEINLELPADLSSDEAQRLASVIQSLPFHS